jgi:hypothetical protein
MIENNVLNVCVQRSIIVFRYSHYIIVQYYSEHYEINVMHIRTVQHHIYFILIICSILYRPHEMFDVSVHCQGVALHA